MSDLQQAIWDAIERRANYSDELARERRISQSRRERDWWEYGDPAKHIPGRIDNQRSRKGKNR